MKKIVMGLLVVCTMLFMTNASMACDCGCDKATISESVECTKDCDCGCQNGEECKCNKSCDKEKCEKKKECCKKCPCGCQNGEKCKCKKECAKQFDKAKCDKTKCDKEKSLLDVRYVLLSITPFQVRANTGARRQAIRPERISFFIILPPLKHFSYQNHCICLCMKYKYSVPFLRKYNLQGQHQHL